MKLSELRNRDKQALVTALDIQGRDALLERFVALGLPTKKSEEYRYFDVKSLLDREYKRVAYIPKAHTISEEIVITDGIVTSAPEGIRVYYSACEQIDMEHFDPIYYLNHLLSPQSITIELDGDTQVEIWHRFTKSDALINYRIVLSNQSNRHSTVYESFEADAISNTLVLYGYDMHIAQDSTLRLVKMQTMQEQRYSMIASHKIDVAKNANMLLKSFDMGGDQGLQLLKVDLQEHAHIDAGHLLYLNEASKRGTVSKIVHKGEHSSSTQIAKNILDGKARGIFDALICVEPTAKYTKAEQNSKAILLHEQAYMAAKPQLEIYIDELEASHGATTGQLDEKQIFYLQSRGISYAEARKMLVIAFATTLIETIKDSRHQERIKEAFESVFNLAHTKESR